MSHPAATPAIDPMSGFECRPFSHRSRVRDVHWSGSGPGVIVMAEMPGIGPRLLRFARGLREAGFTVVLPSLFGRDGAEVSAEEGVAVFRQACVNAEFRALGAGRSSPVTAWLRALARHVHAECGGPGVGAIGLCFTGNFALTMMIEPAVVAPVVAHPSLPLDDPAGLEISAEELAAVRERLERDDLSVQAYRFEGDRFCRAARFDSYQRALGNRFVAHVLPDSAAGTDVNPFFRQHVPCPHSVVTEHLIDEPGQPTAQARDAIVRFFVERLRA